MTTQPQCKSCGADVFFAAHITSGKTMIFDALPNPEGNWVLEENRAMWWTENDNRTRFMPHHATCPSVEQWKKNR